MLLGERNGSRFEAQWVDSLSAAIERLSAGLPDAILLDLSLPDSSGVDTVRNIRIHAQDAPILVLTSHDDEELAHEVLRAGAQEYLVKSKVARTSLVSFIRSAMKVAQADQEQKKSEKSFRVLFASNPLPMWVYDCESLRFLEVNNAAIVHYGYSREEFLAMRITDIHPAEDVPRLLRDVAQARENLQESEGWRHLLKDGRLIDVEIDSHALEFAGRPAVLVTAQDITERKRTEEALRESEGRFRPVWEHATDGMRLTDSQGTVVAVNEAYCRMVGKPRAEVEGYPMSAVYAPADQDRILQKHLERFASREVPTNLEKQMTLWDGRKLWLEVSNCFIETESSRPLLLGIFRDITERKRAEEARRKSEKQYQALVDDLDAIVWEADASTLQFSFVSRRAELILGYPVEQWLTEPDFWINHILPEDRDFAAALCANAVASEKDHELEYRMLNRDGRPVFLHDRVRIIKDAEGRPTVLRGVMMDITERKRAESQIYLQSAALESAANAIITTDRQGEITWANPAFTRLTGYTVEEAFGKNPRILKSGLQTEAFYEEMWKTILAGRVWHGELTNQRKDGSLYEEEMTITPVLDTAGAVANFVAIKQDVSERKRAEKALQVSEARFRELFEHATLGIFRATEDGKLLDVNPALVAMLGYDSAEELLGVNLTTGIYRDPEDRRRLVRLCLENQMHQSTAVEWKRKDGTSIFVRLTGRALQNSRGETEFFEDFVEDVTERKRTEDALRASETHFRELVENATYGIYVSTLDGKFQMVNSALVKMLGYESQSELLAVNLATDVYEDPHERTQLVERFERAQQLEASVVKWKRKDGTQIVVSLRGRGLRNPNGTVDRFEVFVEDITERRSLELQLRQAQKMEAVGRLAGGVAHDFNNLLGVILGYGDLVAEQLKPDDAIFSRVQEILKAGKRATSLTKQLLAFSRQQVLQPQVLNLNSIVEEADKMLRRLIGEDVEMRTSLEPALGKVMADAGQIEQVIMNLAVNARDAMPQGGKLFVKTGNVVLDESYAWQHPPSKAGRFVKLEVTDTGIGMDKETQAHIFEPFFTTKEQGKGTGLGLATVYGIVKQSGGFIWVYSEPGNGTTFKIYLPQVVDSAVDARPEAASASTLRGTETILLVEDEPSLREMTREMLEAYGYTVLESNDPFDAIEIAERHEGAIHLLITDVVMPGMSGRTVAERLKILRPETKSLYVSGYTDDAIVHHGVLEPGSAFLQKPFTQEELTIKIREVLQRPADEP